MPKEISAYFDWETWMCHQRFDHHLIDADVGPGLELSDAPRAGPRGRYVRGLSNPLLCLHMSPGPDRSAAGVVWWRGTGRSPRQAQPGEVLTSHDDGKRYNKLSSHGPELLVVARCVERPSLVRESAFDDVLERPRDRT